MTAAIIETKTIEHAARLTGSKPELLSPAARLVEDLDMDSLQRLEFVMALEREFQIEIDDDSSPPWESWRTISDAVAAVEKEMQQ